MKRSTQMKTHNKLIYLTNMLPKLRKSFFKTSEDLSDSLSYGKILEWKSQLTNTARKGLDRVIRKIFNSHGYNLDEPTRRTLNRLRLRD